MRSKSPVLMNQICKYAEQYYLQNGHSPSTTKIAEAVGISKGTAYKYLVEMADRGMIEYTGSPESKARCMDYADFRHFANCINGER